MLVRDLPEETHRALVRNAERSGQSLQEYLASELGRLAGAPDLDEILERIATRSGGHVGLAQAVADLADERSPE